MKRVKSALDLTEETSKNLKIRSIFPTAMCKTLEPSEDYESRGEHFPPYETNKRCLYIL